MLRDLWYPFAVALTLLTRLPVSLKEEVKDRDLTLSALYYPLVGLIIGIILSISAQFLVILPLDLAALSLLLLWVWITGGLHLDGLADTADAWIGGMAGRERMLHILKDPYCGPFGVTALVLLLLFKFATIKLLLEQQTAYHMWIIAPLTGRIIALFLLLKLTYVREEGMGAIIGRDLPRPIGYGILGFVFIPLLFISTAGGITAIVFSAFLTWHYQKRLGGITGDLIGAAIELGETVVLLALALSV
ncbi:adenosylcobinamide-GDP ribazoletransferase [Magnetococcales bacterium HHB-1]